MTKRNLSCSRVHVTSMILHDVDLSISVGKNGECLEVNVIMARSTLTGEWNCYKFEETINNESPV